MPEDFDEKSEETLNLQKYLEVIARRRWHFLLPLFAGWLMVWSASWVLPSIYRSGTLILVEQPAVPQQFVVPNIGGNIQDRLASITQQILSRTRLLRIIEELHLYPAERKRMGPDAVVELMRKDIEIELVRSSERVPLSAFNIYYSSKDPYVAQKVTSELTHFFISENLEARQQQSENTTNFLESELETAGKALAEQEEKVREFKDQHLGELPGQLQSNLQILSGLQSQLGAQEDALNRAKQQSVYLESLIGQYRVVQGSSQGGEQGAVGLPALEQELGRLRSQLANLSSHYTDRHPDIRKLKDEIAKTEQMKQQIAADLAQKPPDPETNGLSEAGPRGGAEYAPMHELESQLKVNKIEMANRQRAVDQLRGRIGEYQTRLNRAPVREQQLADLTRGYDQSRANYDSLSKKKNDSELATSLERRQQGEHFRILDPPSLPTKPYSPNRLKLAGIGLFVGLILGAAVSVGTEMIDDRIYSEKELKQLVSVAIICEVPNMLTAEEERSQKNSARLVWVVVSVMFGAMIVGTAVSYFRG
jgi:succinoglycan biosynthesis transport protein ExoP